MAIGSCRSERNTDKFRFTFAMLQTVCKYPQSQRLGLSNGFVRVASVSKHARQLQDFRQPATIILSIVLHCEGHHLSPRANSTTIIPYAFDKVDDLVWPVTNGKTPD